jgi:hypothetical protein
MGEDFPLDPDQVQPPQDGHFEHHQDGEATHIEVASHQGDAQLGEVALSSGSQESETHQDEQPIEDSADNHVEDNRVQDVDKARVMAEAGYGLRAMARAKSEYDLPEGKLRNLYKTRMSNRANGAEGAGMTAKEMFEQEAERVEERTGEEYEAARSSDYSHDVEKAMRMIRAEKARKTNLAEKTPLEAGNEYDLERAEKEVGKSLAEVLEASKEGSDKANAYLRFSHLIAEQYRRVGDKLTPNLEALDLAYNFTGGWGHKTLQEHGPNKWVQVAFDADKKGAISITKGNEKWRIPVANSDPDGSNRRSPLNDSATYEVTVNSPDPDEQFDRVQVRKVRNLGEADVENLKKAFGEVRRYDAQKREHTLYPGDDGYEEALADINYGRDL